TPAMAAVVVAPPFVVEASAAKAIWAAVPVAEERLATEKLVEVAPATVRLVVAVPLTVSPPAVVPVPMVLEAYAVRPPLDWVEVALKKPARLNGYAAVREDEETLLLKVFQSVLRR